MAKAAISMIRTTLGDSEHTPDRRPIGKNSIKKIKTLRIDHCHSVAMRLIWRISLSVQKVSVRKRLRWSQRFNANLAISASLES